jgi:polyisoprenoid-binding protein YceI
MTIRRRTGVLLLGTVAALGASGAVAQAAFADPAGCTSSKPTIWISGGKLAGQGTAHCSTGSFRYFTGEIKWDKNFSPDPLVAKTSISSFQDYSVTVLSCDNGNTRSYYSRTYFNSTPSSHHDSAHVHLTAC